MMDVEPPKNAISAEAMQDALNRMLTIIVNIAGDMPQRLFIHFEEKEPIKDFKPVYDMMAEAYLSLKSFSLLMFNRCFTQASAILRTAMEQTSAAIVLLGDDEKRRRFIAMRNEHAYYLGLSEDNKKVFRKEHTKNNNINEYFDYGWFDSKNYGRDQIMDAAHMEEFKQDIKENLNGFSHGSISSFQLSGEKGDWSLLRKHGRRISMACCKLFDLLVCATANFIGDEWFTWPIAECFPKFEGIYLSVFRCWVEP